MAWLKRYAALLVAVAALAVALSNGGSRGPQGEQGLRGPSGESGARGEQGERGSDGADLSNTVDYLGEEVGDLSDTARYLCGSLTDEGRAQAERAFASSVAEAQAKVKDEAARAKVKREAELAEFERKKKSGEIDPDSVAPRHPPFLYTYVPTRGLCK